MFAVPCVTYFFAFSIFPPLPPTSRAGYYLYVFGLGVYSILNFLQILIRFRLVAYTFQAANYLGYRRQRAHPLIRSFVDQILATHQVPNPDRTQELQVERLLVANKVKVD